MNDIYDIPDDIKDAALLIEVWAKKNGWKDWCILGIADRDLVEKMRTGIRKAQNALGEACYEHTTTWKSPVN